MYNTAKYYVILLIYLTVVLGLSFIHHIEVKHAWVQSDHQFSSIEARLINLEKKCD